MLCFFRLFVFRRMQLRFADVLVQVLSRPGGSLLLVGDSGVGRRTSVTLVAFMLVSLPPPSLSCPVKFYVALPLAADESFVFVCPCDV